MFYEIEYKICSTLELQGSFCQYLTGKLILGSKRSPAYITCFSINYVKFVARPMYFLIFRKIFNFRKVVMVRVCVSAVSKFDMVNI